MSSPDPSSGPEVLVMVSISRKVLRPYPSRGHCSPKGEWFLVSQSRRFFSFRTADISQMESCDFVRVLTGVC